MTKQILLVHSAPAGASTPRAAAPQVAGQGPPLSHTASRLRPTAEVPTFQRCQSLPQLPGEGQGRMAAQTRVRGGSTLPGTSKDPQVRSPGLQDGTPQ